MDDITGKTALVTGADRGIGRGIALALAQAGVNVAVNYHTNQANAQEVCALIDSFHVRSLPIQADVSNANQVNHMVQIIEQDLGPVQILVNNAGIIRPMPPEQVDEKSWDEILDTNLKSAFLVTQAVLVTLRKLAWGRIINISSIAAQIGGLSGPHYAASKAGMSGLTHYYASLLAKDGITANTIAPALIETDMLDQLTGVRPEAIPIGRFGTAQEIAEIAVMLARNAYITGQTIHANGGR